MANQKHLDILKQGVDVWNEWREEHADIRPDLSGTDFSVANFHGANLSDAELRGVDLHGAIFSRVYLREANLYNANLSGATLVLANLNLEPIPIGSTISEFQATHSQWERSGFKITGKAVHLSGSCVADQRCKKIWIYQ